MNNSLVAFALFFSIFGILLTTSSSFVQTSDAAMYKVTSGGSLNIILQPTPFPVIKGSQTNLKVSFDQKGSSAVQAQVDYDLTIMKDENQVFQLSSQAGHPNQPLHTTEGIVTIPYNFQQEGTYVINITVYGFLFHPIKPETAQFAMVVARGGSLNVILQPSPFPVIKGSQTNLKVSFDQKGSSALQPHVDYDLTIMKDGKQVFQLSNSTGYPNQPLHTTEGVVTIPYTFQQEGTYVINITVYGFLFHPIKPETAQFTMVVARGGSLNIILQPTPFPVIKGSQTNLKVSFDQKGSSAVQAQVDYDLTIMKDGKQVFQLSSQAGHPNQPLHTTEGVVTIPYTFQQEGTYVINITVYGFLFHPIKPETAQFTMVVARGGSLNIILQPTPFPVIKGSQTNLKVSFDQKGSSAAQPHVDYDLTIMKDGKQVFQLSNSTGYPNQPLHTTEGVVTIPYTFQQVGTYVINITVYGFLFHPIKPETAQFTMVV